MQSAVTSVFFGGSSRKLIYIYMMYIYYVLYMIYMMYIYYVSYMTYKNTHTYIFLLNFHFSCLASPESKRVYISAMVGLKN